MKGGNRWVVWVELCEVCGENGVGEWIKRVCGVNVGVVE